MLLTPIQITLYDSKTQEPKKTYSQSVITFDMLLRASQLSALTEETKPKKQKRWWVWWEKEVQHEEEQITAIMQLVVDFFAEQFTLEELRKGADISEVMTVLQSIMTRASSLAKLNPTQPGRTRSRK